MIKNKLIKHGKTSTRLFTIWSSMKQRCYNPKHVGYKYYSHVKICDQWMDDFKCFYDWAMAHGYSDDLTIDRIDNSGHYEPNNCRWVTIKEQQNNLTTNLKVTKDNKEYNVNEIADITGFSISTIQRRINRNENNESIFNSKRGKALPKKLNGEISGIHFANNRYTTMIYWNGKNNYIGCYEDKESAIKNKLIYEYVLFGKDSKYTDMFDRYGINDALCSNVRLNI